jgi:hypothetical protein
MQPASYELAGDQGDWRETVESRAAQVLRRGFDHATHIQSEKAYLPMHVGPQPLPALWATDHKVTSTVALSVPSEPAPRLPEMRVTNNLNEVLTFFQLHPSAIVKIEDEVRY